MARLRNVCLYLNPDDYERLLRSDFGFHSCYVSNYMSRAVRVPRHDAEVKGLLVQGRRANAPAWVSSERNLIVPVQFEISRYESLSRAERHEFLLEMLTAGLDRAHGHGLPIAELMSAIIAFRDGGYRNEWTHRRRILRTIGLIATLKCTLDPDRFSLRLELTRSGGTIFDAEILETLPDELIFAHQFEDVTERGDAVVVTDK